MSWFKDWFSRRPSAAKTHRRSPAARLEVEGLERRQVPTVFNYGGNILPHVEAQALFLGNKWSSILSARGLLFVPLAFVRVLRPYKHFIHGRVAAGGRAIEQAA